MEQQLGHSFGVRSACHSRNKALEDKVRTMKVLASSRNQERDRNCRKKMVDGDRKASKAEVAVQRTTDVKKRRLIASTENLARFEDMLSRNDHPGQHSRATNVLRNDKQSEVRTIHNSNGSERADS